MEAELNKQPVQLDTNGNEVGTWAGHESRDHGVTGALASLPTVAFFFDGVPPFALTLGIFGLLQGQAQNVFFTSPDCSGPAFIESRPMEAFALAFHARDGSGRTFVSSPSVEVQPTTNSRLDDRSGDCIPGSQQTSRVPAIPVPEMEGRFTPPFQVVTRGDLIAE